MSAIFAVLCFAVLTALNCKFVDGSDCVKDKPAINLDGMTSGYDSRPYEAHKALAFWDVNSTLSFIDGGMKYSNGVITVPYTGTYFVYCQLFYRAPNDPNPRHRIFVNGNVAVGEAGRDGPNSGYHGSYNIGVLVKMQAGDKLTCALRYNSNIWDGTLHSFFGAYMVSLKKDCAATLEA